MTTPVTLMDNLLQEAEQAGMTKEHILEQAHWASLNVEEAMKMKFDELVGEVQSQWGTPEQNTEACSKDGKRGLLPRWLHESVNIAGSTKLLRVAYWKREGGFSYVGLKVEVDSKDRPSYYILVLGSRRRQSEGAKVGKLREKRPWWAFFIPGYH